MSVVPLHLGALHPAEQALTLLLGFGPFLVLGVVVAVRRRRDRAEERAVAAEPQVSGRATPGRPGSPS